ncbi:hypothetical protein B0F90DRAFT_1897590 [Multifurca ochricompacta]|uniref:BHLH domain-containing protein n=1 Tax=Multifurca ochricompacta TaxID=376703 RepID=A0AAD4LWR4_9AGAM|nr:hypothetical protein B0F90DRAFT_1897590 [Multifurca ochricompacta]
MALTLPIPSSPSSASADSPNAPHTPLSPTLPVQTLALPPSDQSSVPSTTNTSSGPLSSANPQAKRKPSRRANTAERRATHNAVERQRRETLNGRFLDLAALLPNLSQIRRPSKSAIVNSSIAHIHASRRHRAMASRELRLMKLEADALRRELNEWRDRANLPRIEEPVRSEAFSMVLSGEVEILTSIPGMDEEEDGEGFGDNDDDLPIRVMSAGIGRSMLEDAEDLNPMVTPTVGSAGNPFAHGVPPHSGAPHLAHILPRPASHSRPIIAQNIPNVSFENPAMTSLFDQHAHVSPQQYQMQFNVGHPIETENFNNNSSKPTRLVYPACDSHGPPPNGAGQPFAAHRAYYQGVPRHQHPGQQIYGSPIDSEDGSSVCSGPGIDGRRRSNSMNGSGYGSPQDAHSGSGSSQPGSYEVPGILTSGIPARMSAGGAMWSRDEMESMAQLKPNMSSAPIAVGGGGNGGGFAMMM